MSSIVLGHRLDGKGLLELNLDVLQASRLLAQAGSGGGKSWLLRRLLEQAYGKRQLIVFDVEGDFVTLRERFDFLIVGKDRDIPADPRAAALLAHKILEYRTNVIFDLFEYSKKETEIYCREMITALLAAPKKLWGTKKLVLLDEVDVLAPERSEGLALSTEAVAALQKRGRKRGFATIVATQRISAVNKTVISQCRNKLIGYADLDLDVKRSAAMLNFRTKEEQNSLVELEAGQFYARGPALAKGVTKVRIDGVKTTHDQAARGAAFRAPKATAEIKKLLEKLTDLPKEAAAELADKEALRGRIRELERELAEARRATPKADPHALVQAQERGYAQAQKEAKAVMGNMHRFKNQLLMKLKDLGALVEREFPELELAAIPAPKHVDTVASRHQVAEARRPPLTAAPGPDSEIGKTERAILKFLAARQGAFFSRSQIGVRTGYSRKSSSFNGALTSLANRGLIARRGPDFQIGAAEEMAVRQVLGSEYGDPVNDRPEAWLEKLATTERKIFEVILDNRTHELSREQISKATGYSLTSSSFSGAISSLTKLGLVRRTPGGLALSHESGGA
jgi:uncharacterized protein DUF87